MRRTLFALTAALVAAAGVTHAVDVGPFNFAKDRSGNTGNVVSMSPYTNEALTGPAASTSATCPSDATKVLFMPAVTGGNFRLKANGSGTPNTAGTAAVTNGTGWMHNYGDWLDINVKVSNTLISSYAVWTSVSDTVPYTCGGK